MARFEDRMAVAGKIAWEGGMDRALDYGIKPEDMPEGDDELFYAWFAMYLAWEVYAEAAAAVEALLPDAE